MNWVITVFLSNHLVSYSSTQCVNLCSVKNCQLSLWSKTLLDWILFASLLCLLISHYVATMISHKTSLFYNFPVQNKKDKKPVGSMDINATFADLPAPELKWEEMAEAPVVRLDGAAIQIKNLLYVFAGYGTINHVRNLLDMSYIVYTFMLRVSRYLLPTFYDIWCMKKWSSDASCN